MIFVVEFDAAIYDAVSGTVSVETLLVSTQAFSTGTTPAYGRLMQPANFERTISGDRALFGLAKIEYGEVVIANADGLLDAWATYGVGDRRIVLRARDAASVTSYPSGWTDVFVATMDTIRPERDTIKIRLKELTSKLDRPMCALFAGTGGLEGQASQIGDPKPITFGAPYNVSPTLIDPQQLIYMVSSRGSVAANHAKDDGSVIARALTAGDDGSAATVDQDAYQTYAALAAASVPIGQYVTLASLGLLKLGSVPAGLLTSDLHEYTGPSAGVPFGTGDRWPDGNHPWAGWDPICHWGSVIRQIALAGGWDAGNISSADVTASQYGQFGFYARDTSTTYASAIGAIAASVGAWCGPDRLGVLRFRKLADPALGSPLYSIHRGNAISLVPRDGGVPAYKIIVNHPKNYTPQSTFAGVVPPSVRTEASRQWARIDAGWDNTVLTQFANAGTVTFDSCLGGYRVTSDGELQIPQTSEVWPELTWFSAARQWFDATLPFSLALLDSGIDIGTIVSLTWDRWGLGAGKKFLVVGIKYELSGAPWVRLTLWG